MTFFDIPPSQFALVASVVGVLLAQELDANEQNSVGNFLVSIGQTLLTSAAQQQLQESQKDNTQVCKQIELLKKQVEILQCQMKKQK